MMNEKVEALKTLLRDLGRGVVAFSGGVDSAFLLAVAHDVLGDRVVALTAVSASMAPWEREEAEVIAKTIGARHILIHTKEMERPEYRANPVNRCFFCKDELFSWALREAEEKGLGVVMDGSNKDDRGDHRPGRAAAKKYGVRSPLDEVGLSKTEIRAFSKEMGLPTWDKPALACLSSRFPYGTAITEERLEKIIFCEKILRGLGFRQFRARFHDTVLRLEIDPSEFDKVMSPATRQEIVTACKKAGFLYVTLDLQGYRSGSLNEGLRDNQAS